MQHAEGGRRPDQRPDLSSMRSAKRGPISHFWCDFCCDKIRAFAPYALLRYRSRRAQPGSQSARAFFAKLGDSCPVIKSPISHAPRHREAGRLLVPSSSSAVASGVCTLARSVSKRGQRMLGSSRRSAAWSAA